jgi:phage shock protein A
MRLSACVSECHHEEASIFFSTKGACSFSFLDKRVQIPLVGKGEEQIMFKRVGNIIRGFFGLFVGGLEKQNPEALLELEKENLRKQIANYNQGLASHAGLCERLISQVKRLEIEDRDLRAKTTALLRLDNRNAAGQYALRLQTVERELAENRSQLEGAEKTYQELMSARDVSIKAAQKKMEELKYALSDLKIKKATAELTEMAGGMIRTIGGAGDTLDRLHNMVAEERDKAAGRVRVAKDSFEIGDIHLKETEQKALADQALADFAAKEGLALPSQASAPATLEHPVKSMGPLPQ